jgi:micrococcal nuclease
MLARGLLSIFVGSALAVGALPASAHAAEHEFKGKVVEVIDGDTIKLLNGGNVEVVRLLHISAPKLAQPFGEKAKKHAENLCLGDQARVVWDDRDAQGHILGTLHEEDGFNVNFEMVKAGFAWDNKAQTHDRTLAELESDARKAKRGLWADPHPTPPWEFEKQQKKSTAAGRGGPLGPGAAGRIMPTLRW